MRMPALLVVLAALALPACGSATGPAPADPGEATPTDHVSLDEGLVGRGLLMQDSPGAAVELCLGPSASSYPPQCGGPTLEGDFSWDQVEAQVEGDVTWTEEPYWVVGRYDPDDGSQGSFTLVRAPSTDPPAGWTAPEPTSVQFPQLCEDPTADVPEVDQVARTAGAGGMTEEQALMELVRTLDGYVSSWVSDGGPTFNVVVSRDPEGARSSIRTVFSGPLCVEQRDLPTEVDVRAAQQALLDRDDLRMTELSSGVSGLLDVGVVVADTVTVEAIHDTVGDWLTPQQVVVRGELQPLRQGS
ncbi:hypothetical protein [Ornithinimicrobium cerasi]|uniref:hypothetical protein n=1 Tax=Ornithinimicrobium cerasi TaxID=2248773 RepID=UPI00137AAD39|nr:hypothetical protein [Ornithinimicrobium cerasi]